MAKLKSRDGNVLPLAGDTGATSPAWAIHWLTVSVYGVEINRVAEIVSEAFHFGGPVGLGGWTRTGGARFYGCRYEYLDATILADPQAPGAQDHVHVVLSGEACAIGVDALLQLLTRLRIWFLRCDVVRLDLAVDGVPFSPMDAYEAVQAKQVVSWVKRGRAYQGGAGEAWARLGQPDVGRLPAPAELAAAVAAERFESILGDPTATPVATVLRNALPKGDSAGSSFEFDELAPEHGLEP